jgi:hypothetical protein
MGLLLELVDGAGIVALLQKVRDNALVVCL